MSQKKLTIGESLKQAVRLQSEGKLSEAECIYEQILNVKPNDLNSLYLLGLIAYEKGENIRSIEFTTHALKVHPLYAEAHNSLGNALCGLGRLDEAAESFQKALEIDPECTDANLNLGNVQVAQGELIEAEKNYRKVLSIRPNNPELHNNLGNLLRKRGRSADAAESFQRAINIKSNCAEWHRNLGFSLVEIGSFVKAISSFKKALKIEPDNVEVYCALGDVFIGLKNLDNGLECYNNAIRINPKSASVYRNLGRALLAQGYFSEARKAFSQEFSIKRKGPWWNASKFLRGKELNLKTSNKAIFTTNFKLRDNVEQLEYLIERELIDPSFKKMVDCYHKVLEEINSRKKTESIIELTRRQSALIEDFYDQVIYFKEAPRLNGDVVNRLQDLITIENQFFSTSSSTTIDNFLSPTALSRLREFCLQSTIYFGTVGDSYTQTKLSEGFNCDLLYQIAEEVKAYLPNILGSYSLANMWAYRHASQSIGVTPHADEGAVTLNFWITPTNANRNPQAGGLVIYDKEIPHDWDFIHYNDNKADPHVYSKISEFLRDAKTTTIPYRENRAVIFKSRLFHKSDQINFIEGFENRRINLSLLFASPGWNK